VEDAAEAHAAALERAPGLGFDTFIVSAPTRTARPKGGKADLGCAPPRAAAPSTSAAASDRTARAARAWGAVHVRRGAGVPHLGGQGVGAWRWMVEGDVQAGPPPGFTTRRAEGCCR